MFSFRSNEVAVFEADVDISEIGHLHNHFPALNMQMVLSILATDYEYAVIYFCNDSNGGQQNSFYFIHVYLTYKNS